MPSKKNKAKGKPPAPSSSTPPPSTSNVDTALSEPPLPTSLPPLPANLPLPSEADDFPTKNARAKALIMSTLVPGSEPYKIAEPLELASDIWKALEDKYAPKDGAKMGRPSAIPEPPTEMVRGRDREPEAERSSTRGEIIDDRLEATVSAFAEDLRTALPPSGASTVSPNATTLPSLGSLGLAPSSHPDDIARRKQIQHATTKVLMQKLPTRDLRFLWAIMYGGENAPWPGNGHVGSAGTG